MESSELRVVDYRTTETYRGFYEGTLSVTNSRISSVFRICVAQMFGNETPVVVVHPAGQDMKKRYPEWAHIARLEGPPARKDNDGRHIVVVWFSDDPPTAGVPDVPLPSGVWENAAEDFVV